MSRLKTFAVRSTELLVASGVVAGVAALTWWGALAPRATSPAVAPVPVSAPVAAVSYVCPSGLGNTLGAINLGDSQESTALTPVSQGERLTYADQVLAAEGTWHSQDSTGGILRLDVSQTSASPSASAPETATPSASQSPAASVPTSASAPATVSASSGTGAVGVVTSLRTGGDLRGLAAAACVPPGAVSWIVGGSIDVGSSAELRVTNPGDTVATATITLYGSTGKIDLPSAGQVAVPAGETKTVLLESAGSSEHRLAMSVESDGGPLAVALATESLDGETPAGTDLITSGAQPATELTVPGVVLVDAVNQGETEKDGAASANEPVVRLVNPGAQPATVTLTMEGKDGAQDLAGATDLVIDPGAVFDVPLGGVAPGAYGVRVTSDLPVGAAVRLVRSAGEYPQRSGALVSDTAWAQATTPSAARAGTIALPRAQGLTPSLVLTSSGSTPATIALTSTDGSWDKTLTITPGSTVVPEVPAEVEALTLSGPAGQDVSAAVVVTAQAQDSVPGELIAVLPAVADSAALSQRQLLLR